MIATLVALALWAGPTPDPNLPYPFSNTPPDTTPTPCVWIGQWNCPPGFTAPDWPKP